MRPSLTTRVWHDGPSAAVQPRPGRASLRHASRWPVLAVLAALATTGVAVVSDGACALAWGKTRATVRARSPTFSLLDYVSSETTSRVPADDGKRPVGHAGGGLPDPSGPGSPASVWGVISYSDAFGQPPRRKASDEDPSSAPYSLNLVDASIQEAADAVLGDIFKVNYTVDPKLEGRVTLRTTTPVTRRGVAELFDAALRSSAAAIVRTGGVLRIVPIEQATMGASVRLAKDPSPEIGHGVTVVPLRFVAAAEMKRLLEPVTSFGGLVRIDASRNALMLSGTEQEIASLREAIAVFDVNILRGMSFALVPVQALDPADLSENLQRAMATSGEGAMSGMVQFIPNKRLRSVLVVSRQPQYLAAAKAWVQQMDRAAGGPAKRFFTYPVRNRQARDLVEVLNAMFSEDTAQAPEVRAPRAARNGVEGGVPLNVADTGAGFSGGASGTLGGAAQGGSEPDRSPDFSTRDEPAGTPTTSRIGLGRDGEPRIRIVADPSQNALIVLAAEADYRRVETAIASLDVMPNQVLIEATIAEVTLNDDLRFGVRWFLENKTESRRAVFSDVIDGAVTSAFPGFSFVAKVAHGSQVTLNALSQVSHVNVLASPSLMVLDKKTATLQIGNEVPITTQSAQGTLTAGAPIVNSIAYKNTGVILAVTPRINVSGRVLLDIDQEVSTVSRTDTSNIDSPTFGRRKVHTSVMANDGENITLGGLIQDRTTHVESQVPFFGDLPLIGNAFKDKQDTVEKTELVIILTPHVVRDLNEAREVTNEYRSKIESLVAFRTPIQRAVHQVKRIVE